MGERRSTVKLIKTETRCGSTEIYRDTETNSRRTRDKEARKRQRGQGGRRKETKGPRDKL